MSEQEHVTLGEVYRICQDIRQDQKDFQDRLHVVENDLLRMKSYLKSYGAILIILGGLGIDWLKKKLGWG